ncbi:MAG: LacI family DNA-binding transcriptional regulator [Pseudomonadota bacterium]
MTDHDVSARPTLADIARLTGVSVATVSRALRGSSEIGQATTERVVAVARTLGYVPNLAARNLARRSTRTLGLLVPDLTDPFHGRIVAGFGRAAQERGFSHIVFEDGRDMQRRERALRTMTEHHAHGIALCSTPLDLEEATRRFAPAHTLFVVPETPLPAPRPSSPPCGVVRSDDAMGMRDITRHLLRHGRRRLSFVSGPAVWSNDVRRTALLDALEEAGEEPRLRDYRHPQGTGALTALAQAVRRERPDALVCYDDVVALHVLDALQEAGMRVPDDVAVTGFDGIEFARLSRPRLTTVVQHCERLGVTAARMLIDAIDSDCGLYDVVLPTRLAIRAST